jgi:hypothetical protein
MQTSQNQTPANRIVGNVFPACQLAAEMRGTRLIGLHDFDHLELTELQKYLAGEPPAGNMCSNDAVFVHFCHFTTVHGQIIALLSSARA